MDSLTFTIEEHKSGYFIINASRFKLLQVFCSFSYNRQKSGRRVNISLLRFPGKNNEEEKMKISPEIKNPMKKGVRY